MINLKACPFCGGSPKYEPPYSTTDYTYAGAIYCLDCSAKIELNNEERKSFSIGYGYLDNKRINHIEEVLFKKWNKREKDE